MPRSLQRGLRGGSKVTPMRLTLVPYILIAALLVSGTAHAACTSPSGVAGQMTLISGAINFCNGTIWVSTKGASLGSCTGSPAGTMQYTAGSFQFCDGTNWYSMKGTSLASCTGIAAGKWSYDSSVNKVKFCDGTNWYDMSAALPTPPSVTSISVLFGSENFNLTTSLRTRLPWPVTGIRVVFSSVISTGASASLSGSCTAPTALSGLGTNTLTWTITSVLNATCTMTFAGTGANALKDQYSQALNGGSNATQNIKVLEGDFNDDGAVNATDLVGINGAIGGAYNIYADINGDGVVNVSDRSIAQARNGTTNP